jgi:hypothetical protein
MHRDARQRAAQPPPPGGWPAGSPSPSSPQGLETRSRKRARTDSASSPSADPNLGAVVDAQRAIRRVTADNYQGHTPSTYKTWLQGIDPRTAGTPAYTSYIGAKVTQHFETGWGVGVVYCIAADPLLKSITRTPPPDALRPTKSQPFSIIWEDNTDSVVDLRTLRQTMRNHEQGLHKPSTSSPPPDVQRTPRAKHGGIPRSCSPLSLLRSPHPHTGSRSASTCCRGRFGKSGPRRWHL